MINGLSKIMDVKVQKTAEKLEKNRFKVFVVDNKEEALAQVKALISPKDKVNLGGSETLFALDLVEELKKMDVEFQNRYEAGVDVGEVFRKAFSCDTYISSVNAITQDGQLYCIDGNGNRTAAITFGPQQVIIVAGYNKIVKDVEDAITRVEQIAAPANSARLGYHNPCTVVGECTNCFSETRICSTKTLFSRSATKDRIKVIIVKENLGY